MKISWWLQQRVEKSDLIQCVSRIDSHSPEKFSFNPLNSYLCLSDGDQSMTCTIYIYIQGDQEEGTKLRESVPYVKIYRYNPKHLYPKSTGYGDNGQRSLKL